jgi:hypothetical protein
MTDSVPMIVCELFTAPVTHVFESRVLVEANFSSGSLNDNLNFIRFSIRVLISRIIENCSSNSSSFK